VALFRLFMSLGMYAVPLVCGVLLGQGLYSDGIFVTLVTAAAGGVALSSLYIWKVAVALDGQENSGVGYGGAWWDARWLGMNQLAVVVDVRVPLIILGVMLGEAAVGLYGLVQRTTAVVELAWASISRLLLTSYAELVGEHGARRMRTQVIHAGRVTAVIMVAAAISLWCAGLLIARIVTLSSEAAIALSLLQWAIAAIGLSSIKRPFVSGLIALYQDRPIGRVNMGVAAAGLILVPLLIAYFGIWGPVLSWVILEAVACALIIHLFLSVPLAPEAGPNPSLSPRGPLNGAVRSR
jgi:O-antigen/teichoic acid export membrane protein